MDDNRIIVDIQNVVIDQTGAASREGGMMGSVPSTPNQIFGAISAQLLIKSASRLISASGNQELSKAMNQGASYLFLGARALSMDPTAIITLGVKLISDVSKLIDEFEQQKRDQAQAYNELDMMKMMTGQLVIQSNTEISYNKYGRFKLTDRK